VEAGAKAALGGRSAAARSDAEQEKRIKQLERALGRSHLNFGKTPAIKLRSHSEVLVFTDKSVSDKADAFFNSFNESMMSDESEIILPPGIPPDAKKAFDYITVSSIGGPKTQIGINTINNTDWSFGIVGVLLYLDSSGGSYRTDFCIAHLATGALKWCPRHNEIH